MLHTTAKFTLETKRLILRCLSLDDLGDLAKLYSEPDLGYFSEHTVILKKTKEELKWIIDVHYGQHGFGLWATLDKTTGKFIGRCGLIPWALDGKQEVEVAYHIDKNYRGQGLATEAARAIRDYGFEHLEMPRLVCLIDPDNSASIRVAEKIGMQLYQTLDGIIHEERPTLVYSQRYLNTITLDSIGDT